jgi:hypothetical protein
MQQLKLNHQLGSTGQHLDKRGRDERGTID